MADQRIQYTEQMVGANHPTLQDTLNRLTLVEHNNDGTHKLVNTFDVVRQSAQSINPGAWTKVLWNGKNWDGGSNFDLTNSRFLPQKAGVYSLLATLYLSNITAGKITNIAIWKNGAEFRTGSFLIQSATGDISLSVSADVMANGTTDYFEIYVYHNDTAAKNVVNGNGTHFSGHWVGSWY